MVCRAERRAWRRGLGPGCRQALEGPAVMGESSLERRGMVETEGFTPAGLQTPVTRSLICLFFPMKRVTYSHGHENQCVQREAKVEAILPLLPDPAALSGAHQHDCQFLA